MDTVNTYRSGSGIKHKVIKIIPTLPKLAERISSTNFLLNIWPLNISNNADLLPIWVIFHTRKLLTGRKFFLWLRWYRSVTSNCFVVLVPDSTPEKKKELKIRLFLVIILQICEIKDSVSPGLSHHQLKLSSSFLFSHGALSRPFTILRGRIYAFPKRWKELRFQDKQKGMVGTAGSPCTQGYKEHTDQHQPA